MNATGLESSRDERGLSMDHQPPSPAGPDADAPTAVPPRSSAPTRKRSSSGASGLLSKLPFMRSTGEHRPRSRRNTLETEPTPAPMQPFPTIPAGADPPSRQAAAATAAPLPLPQMLQLQAVQQQKTRRRRGSLRKVALLGRGAQREKREARNLTIDTKLHVNGNNGTVPESQNKGTGMLTASPTTLDGYPKSGLDLKDGGDGDKAPFGLGISDLTPRPSMDGYATRSGTPSSDPEATPTTATVPSTAHPTSNRRHAATGLSPTRSYSTTDDEDGLHMSRPNGATSAARPPAPSSSLSSSSAASLVRPERASLSSGSESYILTLPHSHSHSHSHPRPLGTASGSSTLPSIQRRRGTIQRAKSPLALTSLAGLSTTPLPPPDADWDYSETEWWGWIILLVTWTVFVVGMGSCLGVWSWAWDVGTTPYAPPELEDDPTLPIVGYYPALMILTGVMAWVWVVVAWVGMKYFRHAQVSGD
ncbi:hypothetical protein N656DRAFT_777753 [Canariomyces notabilis]|uniref:Uncharacterized protein n=1 Tax=Canariomyces notabilis TaxID=2074819 RepID=A0AAN6YTP3_9PEZI|nr:hypothetical protein N656DRAFT_777753 [Canariomyces arenarius]